MHKACWEHFEHVADIGIRGIGKTLSESFELAAQAMTAVITDLNQVDEVKPIKIHCQAPDNELLFADWINALIFEMATRKMLFSRFQVSIEDYSLTATAWGEAIDREKHSPSVEIKGATYTELKVEQQSDGFWLAQCVVDV